MTRYSSYKRKTYTPSARLAPPRPGSDQLALTRRFTPFPDADRWAGLAAFPAFAAALAARAAAGSPGTAGPCRTSEAGRAWQPSRRGTPAGSGSPPAAPERLRDPPEHRQRVAVVIGVLETADDRRHRPDPAGETPLGQPDLRPKPVDRTGHLGVGLRRLDASDFAGSSPM